MLPDARSPQNAGICAGGVIGLFLGQWVVNGAVKIATAFWRQIVNRFDDCGGRHVAAGMSPSPWPPIAKTRILRSATWSASNISYFMDF